MDDYNNLKNEVLKFLIDIALLACAMVLSKSVSKNGPCYNIKTKTRCE